MVTTAADSKGVTKRLVTAESTGLKVARFDIDTWIALFLGNITDLGHPEGRSGYNVAGNARRSLERILLKHYSECQEDSGGNQKYFGDEENSVAGIDSNASQSLHNLREREG